MGDGNQLGAQRAALALTLTLTLTPSPSPNPDPNPNPNQVRNAQRAGVAEVLIGALDQQMIDMCVT